MVELTKEQADELLAMKDEICVTTYMPNGDVKAIDICELEMLNNAQVTLPIGYYASALFVSSTRH